MAAPGRARWLWLTLAILAADRATKYSVEQHVSQGSRREFLPHFAALVHSQNPGIAFGFFSESTSRSISLMLIGSSAAIILLLCWWLVAGRAGGVLGQAGVALIAGGASGNLLDRLLHGGVTDFLELHAGQFIWPPFNFADSAITVGAILLLWALLLDARPPRGEHA